MNRRKMITALGGAVAWPLAALHNGARRIEQLRPPVEKNRPGRKVPPGSPKTRFYPTRRARHVMMHRHFAGRHFLF